jgi:glycosyltransferase involved in cell wall biosynthesis
LKIAFIHTDFPLYWHSRFQALTVFLNERGHTLDVIEVTGRASNYLFEQREKINETVTWHCLYPGRTMEAISIHELHLKLEIITEQIDPDIIFAGAIAFPSGAFTCRYGTKRKKPVIIFDNARLQDTPRSFVVNFIKRQIYKHVDAIFCPAPSFADTYKFFGFPDDRIFFGLNVVDNKYFKDSVEKIRNEGGGNSLTLPKHFFLGVGRQIPKKNWIALVKAFNEFCDDQPQSPFYLVLVGDGPERSILVENANNRVLFHPFADQEKICTYYAHADCLILPSLYGETWGLVVNEAMASRLPVMVSERCGCASTLTEDNVNGWRFDPFDVHQLTVLLKRFVASDSFTRKQMGNESLRIISSWDLDRFCNGVWEAMNYTLVNKKKTGTLISRFFVHFWKGRYRPT